MATTTWNIPWIESKMFSIEFKTDIDGEYTAHEQRDKLYLSPRYGWTLRVEKTIANFKLLRQYFEARGGRFNAFFWKWDSTIDELGDDVTYLVRLNADRFEFDDEGDFWLVPIVTVVTDE